MTDISINRIKWFSTFLILSGILLTNLNAYPYNICLLYTSDAADEL